VVTSGVIKTIKSFGSEPEPGKDGYQMNEEKRAYSWNQFIESGFDGRDYQFPTFDGSHDATIVCKRWNKSRNLLVYLDLDDGRKVVTATWNRDNYYGLADLPMGSRVRVKFVKSAKGVFYLRGVEEI